MRLTRRRLWRLFAVMAVASAMLVPAAVASAGSSGGIDDHECEEDHYQSTNPQHVLYGRTQGTPVGLDGKMHLDLSGFGFGVVAFWDEHFSTGSDGVVLVGTNFADVLCGTTGTDEIWGLQGNDRIFGQGAGDGDAPDYSILIPGSGDRLYGNKGHDFITPGDGTGLGDMNDDYAVVVGGGRGNDVLYAGNGDFSLVRGGMGNDSLFGGVSSDPDDQILRGGDDDDVIDVNGGDRTVAEGSAGNDVIDGGWGDYQVLNGNNGMDEINGGSGDYQRGFGGADDDELNAGSGSPQALFGGSGNDLITGAGTGFWGFGGSDNDTLLGSTGNDCLYGDLAASAAQEGECQEFGVGNWTGQPGGFGQVFPVGAATTGNDYIEGDDGYDSLFGGPGSDNIYGNTPKLTNPNIGLDLADGDDDDLFGDDGNDTLFANGSSGCIEDDFGNGGANFAAGDSSWGLERVTNTFNVENWSDEAACPVGP